MTRSIFRICIFVGLLFIASLCPAQTWTSLNNQPPASVGLCLLLTDGTAMCQSGAAWYKLKPDATGSYVNGTWSATASMPSGYDADDFASAVLADGRLVVVGGEYNNGSFALTNMGAIYDPAANTWTMISPPPSTGTPNHWACIGDAPATVLADGRLLIGSKLYQDTAALDPGTLTWSILSETGKTDGFNSEEGWTLLPDGSVFTVDVKNAPASERLLLSSPTSGTWVSSGNTLQDLHTPTTSGVLNAPGCPAYNPPGEMGPQLLLPNGTVYAIGASGYTGIYTPPAAGSTAAGTWAIGPAMPSGLNVEDGPAAILPSGHVLFGGSPGGSGAGLKYFEFNGTSLVSVPAPSRASSDATYYTSLLVLPTGQVMFVDGSRTVQIYTPAASPTYNASWAPAITSVPSILSNSTTYQISGTQFNGLSQGSAFGDESQNATNYPLVKITNNSTGHVFYAKTHGHSTMGVATGTAIVSTNFDVPAQIDPGPSTIQVVANGIPSVGVAVTISAGNIATSTKATSSPNPSSFGQSVTFTSTTTSTNGTPSGTVTFTEGATVWASNLPVNSAGQASFSTTTLAVGSHILTATFTGNTGWGNSSGIAPAQQVNGVVTGTTAVSSPNPSNYGQSVTFTSTTTSANGTPSGTVTFTEGSTVWASNVPVNSAGQASFSTTTLAVGSHILTATFTGNTGWGNSSGNAPAQQVNGTATSTKAVSSPNPSNYGQSVTFTSTTTSSSGVPVGTVTFTEGATVWASNVPVNSAGQASFSTTALPVGSHILTATFTGSGAWASSSGSANAQQVNGGATTTKAASSPNPSRLGMSVTFTSTTTSTSGTPVGTVTFTEGSKVWASNVPVNSSGKASFSTTALTAGTHTILATFTGANGWVGSSANAPPQTVLKRFF